MIERGLSADHIAVVPNGLAHDVYKPDFDLRSPTPLVAHIGRLEFYKRVDLLLEAVPLLRAEVPDVRVAIIGEGNALPSLQRLAARLGIEDVVDFLGFVDESAKVKMLQRAHVLANPSEKEGWGLTVLEGAACGTPTVASNVPGLRDSVLDGKTGLLVPHGDVPALARALSSVLRDAVLRERLSAEAVAWAARFQWDASTEDMETLLVDIASGVAPSAVRHYASAYANASR
jgi:glycosyltransferase involved in cell wall biosynthesis